MLRALRKTGRVLLMTTSKSEEFAKKILDHFSMAEYFNFTGGTGTGETRARRTDVIWYVLRQYGLESGNEIVGRCVMVEDREHDVPRARKYSMECVDVLYGCRNRQEMDAYRPAWAAGTAKDLGDLLLSL